jgi:beta-mannosidase
MERMSLAGKWILHLDKQGRDYETEVPTSDYNALLKNKIIDDPFYKTNEQKCLYVAETGKSFKRSFKISQEQLEYRKALLRCQMLDTIAQIYINDKLANISSNAYICSETNITDYLHEGENSIEIHFLSPVQYVKAKQEEEPLPANANGINGVAHIRKPACHFGWDWGINMPVSGIFGNIEILFYNNEIRDFWVRQEHLENGTVKLHIRANKRLDGSGEITAPNGEHIPFGIENGKAKVIIEKPQLWWTRELSGNESQPLYTIGIGSVKKRIGLRTIELDRSNDEYGADFKFILNGVPIFAKGANVIPPDAMPDRIGKSTAEKIVSDAVHANFNMIRIWGGGYYGSDELYDLCDEKGILVWQDFMFACLMYPFYDEAFIKNVLGEVKYNVRRISSHPSLALWCGNNEIEFMFQHLPASLKIVKSYKEFFYEILPGELRRYDKNTPYIETSPIGSEFRKDITADKCGDTHMWHVWHGSKDLSYYGKRYTRFCSEYGMESLPSEDCILQFATQKDMDLKSDVMLSHQKCKSGNDKMLFYLYEKFNKPAKFTDLIYLTGLVQAECVANGAEHWRRNKGRCNGALWWQMNDCWGAPSWSSVDYFGKWKPLMYAGKRIFEPITISLRQTDGGFELYVLNDTLNDEEYTAVVSLKDFTGKELRSKSLLVNSNAGKAQKAFFISAKGLKKSTCFAQAELRKNNKAVISRTAIMLPERKLKLQHAKITIHLCKNEMTLESNTYARSVFVDIKGESVPLSDNCFDLVPGEKKTIYLEKDCKIDPKSISVKCVNNIIYAGSDAERIRFRKAFSAQPMNIANKIYYSIS